MGWICSCPEACNESKRKRPYHRAVGSQEKLCLNEVDQDLYSCGLSSPVGQEGNRPQPPWDPRLFVFYLLTRVRSYFVQEQQKQHEVYEKIQKGKEKSRCMIGRPRESKPLINIHCRINRKMSGNIFCIYHRVQEDLAFLKCKIRRRKWTQGLWSRWRYR